MERVLYQNLSGNEVYYINSLILLVKNVLCSNLRYQKGFNLIAFSYKPVKCVELTDIGKEELEEIQNEVCLPAFGIEWH